MFGVEGVNCFMVMMMMVIYGVDSYEVTCNRSEYFDPALLMCQSCPANVSMVASVDGFSCTCEENSVPVGVDRCRKCNVTEVVSADGAACVPCKCQSSAGRFICRKCPNDYISVTQNLDGSPTKEVLCVKCARGYKPRDNVCVRCPSCVCAKGDVAVGGACVPKRYLHERPKYEGKMHSDKLVGVLKSEYLCTKGDFLACRALSHECVKHFYTSDVGGPCRLWVQPKMATPKGVPELLLVTSSYEMKPGEFILPHAKDSLSLVLIEYTHNGGLQILGSTENKPYKCSLPLEVSIGSDLTYDCVINITELITLSKNSTYSVYLSSNGALKPLPIVMRKPGGYYVKRETWRNDNFRRFFLVDTFLTTNNATNTVYLRTLLIRIGIERDKYHTSSLRVLIGVETQYSIKSSLIQTVTTTLRVEHDMPDAGIFRGLEIWGGVLGSFLFLYAVVRWRGETRRGGLHFSLIPHLAGCLADALYFAVWFSTLHGLAAEAGALGITLPLSAAEEQVVKAFIYSTVCLKMVKVVWINWKQCTCDIFFLDWTEYNSSSNASVSRESDWRAVTLAKEWNRLQTKRLAPPSYTIVLTLVVLQLLSPWHRRIGQSPAYKWAAAGVAWWSSYVVLLAARWVLYRVTPSPPACLPNVSKAVGFSILVFEEEHYAHYVHGRNDDDKDLRMMAGPLAMCRVVMAPQLRIVYNQLSNLRYDGTDGVEKRAILSRLLAAFFERALDGLNWVASERGYLERLLDVELTDREGGTTSVLLYDPDEKVPSCVAVTWWGNEWSVGTLDGMLFGCVLFATDDALLAALTTVILWQVSKHIRLWFGRRNQKIKTNIDCMIY